MWHKTEYGIDVSVEIERVDDTAYVHVHAPLYMNPHWVMPHCYSSEFTDAEILNDRDFHKVLSNRY